MRAMAGRLPYLCTLTDLPPWAKPIVQAALDAAITLPTHGAGGPRPEIDLDDSASLLDDMEDGT